LSRSDIDAAQLTGQDRLVYGRAVEAVKEHGASLDAVALVDAARFYARHHGRGITRKSVTEAVDAIVAAKTAKGVSAVYLADLRYRLGVFCEAFYCEVNELTPDDLKSFFEAQPAKLSARSHNNFLRTIRTFLRFAQNHGWLSKEANLLARVEKRSEKATPVKDASRVHVP
jgi:hypothetical protein